VLAELAPSPVLGLSRAVAVALAAGSAAGLESAADLEAPGALRGNLLLPATRAACSGASAAPRRPPPVTGTPSNRRPPTPGAAPSPAPEAS